MAYKYTRNVTLIKAAVASFAKYTSLQYSMHLVQLSGFIAPAYIIIVVTCEAMPVWYMPIPCVWLSATIWCSTEKAKCRTMWTTPLTVHMCKQPTITIEYGGHGQVLSMVNNDRHCWSHSASSFVYSLMDVALSIGISGYLFRVGWGLMALLTQFRSYCAFTVKTIL